MFVRTSCAITLALAAAGCACDAECRRKYDEYESRGAPALRPYSPATAAVAGLIPWAGPAYVDGCMAGSPLSIVSYPCYLVGSSMIARDRNRRATVDYYETGAGAGFYDR